MKLELINETLIIEANWYKKKKYEDVEQLLKDFAEDHANELDLWFISFTSIEKLGINPQSKYQTPLGIYAYQLGYVTEHEFLSDIPFASNQPFINLFRIKNYAVILKESDVGGEYQKKLNKIYPGIFDSSVEKMEEFSLRSNISQLWLHVRFAADNDPKKWNHIFRKIGIDGVVDNGTGTIHPSEPTQTVLFSSNIIDKNIRLMNKGIKFDKKSGEYTKAKKAAKYISTKMQSLVITAVKRNDLEKLDEILKSPYRKYIDEVEIADRIVSYISYRKKYDDLPSIIEIFNKNTSGIVRISLVIEARSMETDDPQLYMKILHIFDKYDSFMGDLDKNIIKLVHLHTGPMPNVLKYLLDSEETRDKVDPGYLFQHLGSMFDDFYKSQGAIYEILYQYFEGKGYITNSRDANHFLNEIINALSGTTSPTIYFAATMRDLSKVGDKLQISYNKMASAIITGLVKNTHHNKFVLRKKAAETSKKYGLDEALIAYGPFAASNDLEGFKTMHEQNGFDIYPEFVEYAKKHANEEFNSYLIGMPIEQKPFEYMDDL